MSHYQTPEFREAFKALCRELLRYRAEHHDNPVGFSASYENFDALRQEYPSRDYFFLDINGLTIVQYSKQEEGYKLLTSLDKKPREFIVECYHSGMHEDWVFMTEFDINGSRHRLGSLPHGLVNRVKGCFPVKGLDDALKAWIERYINLYDPLIEVSVILILCPPRSA